MELFQRTQTTTFNTTTQPHSNTLHFMTKMPSMSTPLLGSSSPSPQEWTHRPILIYPPEQNQDPLHQLLTADSLMLDWHPIVNVVAEQAEKLIRGRKDWTANPPAQPGNQGANPNPMLPNTTITLYI